jgi:putative oxidoreductase
MNQQAVGLTLKKSTAMSSVAVSFEPYAFALFRIVFGLLFLQFSTQKLFGWPNIPTGYTPETILIIAACIELICGFLIMIGLFANFAAFVGSGEMLLLCFAFPFIAAHGAGVWSVDSLWRRRVL